ncbi:MAG: BlaI/MecI/CopY family transcriptional regulator [bacterium]|nr:BlaI/MecI/CopY family transcriptional regulator [bacterium]
MLKAVKDDPSDHGPPPEKLSPREWPVLRACWRLGEGASTAGIVGELQKTETVSYRDVLVILERLTDKGYLAVEREGPRKQVWTLLASAEVAIIEEMKHVVRQTLGADRRSTWLMRRVLKELEAELPDSE